VLVPPAAVRTVNLDEPIADDLRLGPARDGGHYRSLLVVGQRGEAPAGVAVITVGEGGVVPRDRLEWELRRQIHVNRNDGLSGPTNLGASRENGVASTGERLGVEGATRRYVSVVVTTCRSPDRLERCLRSILACEYVAFEVVVVENRPGSPVTRRMLSERFPTESRVRYVEESRPGLSSARNAGLAVAGGDVVAFTDDDVVVDRAWIRRFADAFDQREDIGCVTGLILPLELETGTQLQLEQFMALSKGFNWQVFRLPEALDAYPLLPYTAGVVGSGANTALRSDIAHEIGGFDPTLGTGTPAAGGEDLDLYIRLLRCGHAIAYEPGAIIWHEHPSGTAKLHHQVYWYGVGLGATFTKQLIAGPGRRQLVRAVPAGVRYLLDPASRKNANKAHGYLRRLDWLERFGMVAGPLAYLASLLLHRWRSRAQRRARAPDQRVREWVKTDRKVEFVDIGARPFGVRWRGAIDPTRERAGASFSEESVAAIAIAACLATLFCVILHAPPAVRFAEALVFLSVAPGTALIRVLRGPLDFGLVLATSLGLTVLVAQIMLWLRAWEPELFLCGFSAACLLPLLGRVDLTRQRFRTWLITRRRMAARWIPASAVVHGALIATAMLCWGWSLANTDLNRMAGLGLLDALPRTYFAAFALLLVGLTAAITRPEVDPKVMAGYALALIVVLHGTTPVLYDQPRYQWVYNHFAVIDFIATHGRVDRNIDIYNNWPGFFAANAWLRQISGVMPLTYGPWAQVFFNVATVATLRFALSALTRSERMLWAATCLFIVGNWLGQDYLAPQAFGFTMSLVVIGVFLRYPRPATRSRARTGRRWKAWLPTMAKLVPRRPPVGEPPDADPLAMRLVVVAGGVCYLAVVVSHQLTPVMLIVAAIALALIRRIPWWVPLAMAIIEACWIALAWSYINAHFTLLDPQPTASAAPAGYNLGQGLPDVELVAYAARIVVVIMAALAAIGIVRRLRAGRWDLVPAILAAAPLAVVGLQSYGGEGRYRVYLFALPWLCFLGAAALVGGPSHSQPRSLRASLMSRARAWGRLGLTSLALGGGTLVAYFGLEYINHVTRDDVAGAVWFDQHVPPRSLLVSVTSNVVSRVTARYAVVSHPWYTNVPALTERAPFRGHLLGRQDLAAVEAALRDYGVRHTYLIFTESEERYARLYGLLPRGWASRFERVLRSSRSFKLVYGRGTSQIFAYTPQGATGGAS
jgi:GT2 family glycosyltransferase